MKAISTIEATLTSALLAAQAENKPIKRADGDNCALGHLPHIHSSYNASNAVKTFGISLGGAWCIMAGWDGLKLENVFPEAKKSIKTKSGKALYDLGARLAKKFVK